LRRFYKPTKYLNSTHNIPVSNLSSANRGLRLEDVEVRFDFMNQKFLVSNLSSANRGLRRNEFSKRTHRTNHARFYCFKPILG